MKESGKKVHKRRWIFKKGSEEKGGDTNIQKQHEAERKEGQKKKRQKYVEYRG